MTEDTQRQTPAKTSENMQRDIRGIYLLLQIWFTLFVIGAIIALIVVANS